MGEMDWRDEYDSAIAERNRLIMALTAAEKRAEAAEKRVAELEARLAAQEWRPVTEPPWIDASERQPPDTADRPVYSVEYGWWLGRYVNGQWRRDIQRGDIAINVTHWIEVYPLPSGRSPTPLTP